jgi:hypothetical protein
MQMGTLAIVRPPTEGDNELASRLSKGFEDASHGVAMFSSPELCAMDTEVLRGATLLVATPARCIETSGDETEFLSKLASANKRILASVGPVDSPAYKRRLQTGIDFDAVFDLGFASQRDDHIGVSDVPYHFVFNGPITDEEPLAEEPANQVDRTITWVLVGPKSDGNKNVLAELFEHEVDPGGFCLLQGRARIMAEPPLGSEGLAAVLARARFYLWGADRDTGYYESFRFMAPLLAGTVPCKIDPDLASEGLDIPGVYPSVSAFRAEVEAEGHLALYRRARDFYVARGRLAEHLSGALALV